MDCNKEEALRAKDIAEKKMESKDFSGAHKLAIKAQQLYPDLENIAQMLIVCDVHCSAEQRLYGNEMNWYKILQIELTADDATIKKQYRKFALQLHPDKNKFAGAEAAFKLIGEAQRVLLDRDKRSELDRKCRISVNRSTMPSHHHQKVQMNFNSVVRNTVRPNFTNFHPPWQQQQSSQSSQQGPNGIRRTFWTACSFCSVRYEYHREVLNRSLRCQQCNRPFIAYDVDAQGPTPATNSSQQAFGQQNYGLNHGTFNVGVGSQGNLHANKPNKQSNEKKGSTSNASRKPNGKRKRKQVSESSESADSSGSSDSEDDMFADNDGSSDVQKQSIYREERPRRSTRQKQQVSYKENASDDDDDSFQPSRRDKGSGSSGHADEMNHQNGIAADQKEVKKKQSFYSEEGLVNRNGKIKEVRGKEAVEDSSTDEATENVVVYPDPEFSDFDKDKKEECFAAGQIWAIYDTADGMPRFYALIRKVLSPGFKVQITWFEPDPDDDHEINWASEQLPVACGKYRLGSTDIAEGHQTFSHLILCEKSGRRNYKVYPRKGETWALFKNWDIKWYEDAKSHQQYDFEFVEILSDYVEGEGVDVAYLAKLKGFVSLFYPIMKEGVHSFQIPSAELFRFSHRVPSFKMTGQEGVGVPVGSFELDPVSLPMNLEEINVPQDAKVKFCRSPSVGMCSRSSDVLKNMSKSDGDASASKVNLERRSSAGENKDSVDNIDDGRSPSDKAAIVVDLPDPQFFNFDETRSPAKFQIGQIWAFYSDEDGTPKYYGQIMGVRTRPDLELHVTWLTNCWLPEDAVRWQDKNMIISCGRFKIEAGAKSRIYHDTNSFSHQVHTITDGKSKEYGIFPRKGEVWALYRKWTTKIKRSDLSNWEYYIVEVVAESDSAIEVLPLDKVIGFDSVFKGTSSRTMQVARKKLMMFSHQVPAFRLTEEHGNGKLKGYLELDPGALPTHYFSPK